MGETTGIAWTDATFNPWWGCFKVSAGCAHCYADTLASRYGFDIWGPPATTERRLFGEKHWAEPLRWNAAAERDRQRRRVFCASMADVFEDHPQLPPERAKLWQLIERTPWLDWQLLTKRPENVFGMVPDRWIFWPDLAWPVNCWVGTSVEDQEQAEKRIPELLAVPAPVRFLSCEPLLGVLDLRRWLDAETARCDSCATESWAYDCGCACHSDEGVGWVIVGGESGPGFRPMDLDWARSIRDQCQAAGVPLFFKQVGGLTSKSGGRLLDGRTWSEFPVVHGELVGAAR
jgi:protein gp37